MDQFPEVRPMRCLLFAEFVLVTAILVGCGPAEPDNRAASRAIVGRLAGLYRPSSDTMEWIRETGGYADRDISIELKADSTFEVRNIPDWWRKAARIPTGDFDSGRG